MPNPTPLPCPSQLNDKSGNAGYNLRQLYQKLLEPYEEWARSRQDGGYGLLGEHRPV